MMVLYKVLYIRLIKFNIAQQTPRAWELAWFSKSGKDTPQSRVIIMKISHQIHILENPFVEDLSSYPQNVEFIYFFFIGKIADFL